MSVVNVKVKYIRTEGFMNLIEWNKDLNNIYIGRRVVYVKGAEKSKWCNPFSVKKYGLDKCLELFEDYIRNDPDLISSILELKNKKLGCWCNPGKCHGDILLKLLKEKELLEEEKE